MSNLLKRQFTFACDSLPTQTKSAFTALDDENPKSPGDFGQLIKSTPFKSLASPAKMVALDSGSQTVKSSQASQLDSFSSHVSQTSQSSETKLSKQADKNYSRKTSIINHFLNDLTENHEEIRRKR